MDVLGSSQAFLTGFQILTVGKGALFKAIGATDEDETDFLTDSTVKHEGREKTPCLETINN